MTKRIRIGEHGYTVHLEEFEYVIYSGESRIFMKDFNDLGIKYEEYSTQLEVSELLLKLEEAVRQEETSLRDINAGRSEYDMAVNSTLRIKNNITDLLKGATWS